MPSIIENEAIQGLLALKQLAPPKKKTLYEIRCACMKKARETRLANLAARKKKYTKTP